MQTDVRVELAEKQASMKEKEMPLADPVALSRHLRFALAMAGASLFSVVALLVAVRVLALTDKQVALISVVALAAAALCVVALLSAGTAAGAAYARQCVALRLAQREKEYAAIRAKFLKED